MLEVEERVNHLDELMAQLLKTVDQTSREMRQSDERSKREMQEFKEEMRQSDERSKREMQEFKKEMREFKQEMRESREHSEREMQEFKAEMRLAHERAEERSQREIRESKAEMRDFKDEMRQLKKNSDKQWGELSKKLGTMAEDLVAPSIPRILKQVTGCTEELDYFACRIKVKKPQTKEFDVIAVCRDYVFVNETKNTLRSEYINDFYEKMQRIHEYFPLWTEKRFIGAIASLYVDEMLVRQGERLGLIVLGFGEELMDVLNSLGFRPRVF